METTRRKTECILEGIALRMEGGKTIGDWELQVTEADPSGRPCASAGSAFYRKVREELRGSGGELWAGAARRAARGAPVASEAGPSSSGPLQRDPAVTGPAQRRALGGHADEDGTPGWSLGW